MTVSDTDQFNQIHFIEITRRRHFPSNKISHSSSSHFSSLFFLFLLSSYRMCLFAFFFLLHCSHPFRFFSFLFLLALSSLVFTSGLGLLPLILYDCFPLSFCYVKIPFGKISPLDTSGSLHEMPGKLIPCTF